MIAIGIRGTRLTALGLLGLGLGGNARAQKSLPPPEPPADYTRGIVHSRRQEFGAAIGGLGTGSFTLLPDGTTTQATFGNPTGPPTGDLPGCFAAVWTRTGGPNAPRVNARVLALHSAYGLPTCVRLDYDGQSPQARLDFPDAIFPLTVTMQAFSPLVPYSLAKSAYPGGAFIFRLRNTSAAPVELSVALSCENLLHGQVGTLNSAPAPNAPAPPDKLGDNSVAPLASQLGYFGLTFTGVGADSGLALLTYPPRRDAVVTMTTWDARADRPGWWEEFARDGSVGAEPTGANSPNALPRRSAGVVAARLTLNAHGYVDLPFALTWRTPYAGLGNQPEMQPYSRLLFPDAASAARRLLQDWRSLLSLTEETQEYLLASNLPAPLPRRLVNAVSPLVARSLLTRSERFAFLPAPPTGAMPSDAPTALALPDTPLVTTPLLAFFPALAAQELANSLARTVPSAQPADTPDERARRLTPPPTETPGAATTPAAATTSQIAPPAAVLAPASPNVPITQSVSPVNAELALPLFTQAARYVLWTGDRPFLAARWPVLKTLLAGLLSSVSGAAGTSGDFPTASAAGSSLTPADWLTALHYGQKLAEKNGDGETAQQCAAAREHWTAQAGASEAEKSLAEEGKRLASAPGTAFDWNALYALTGFDFDLDAGELTLRPPLPGPRGLAAPLFAPTFWGSLHYSLNARGSALIFRLDRALSYVTGDAARTPTGGTTLTLKTLRVNDLPPGWTRPNAPPNVRVSLRQTVLGVRARREAGHLRLDFETPLALAAGDRLEIDVLP